VLGFAYIGSRAEGSGVAKRALHGSYSYCIPVDSAVSHVRNESYSYINTAWQLYAKILFQVLNPCVTRSTFDYMKTYIILFV